MDQINQQDSWFTNSIHDDHENFGLFSHVDILPEDNTNEENSYENYFLTFAKELDQKTLPAQQALEAQTEKP